MLWWLMITACLEEKSRFRFIRDEKLPIWLPKQVEIA